MNDNETKIGDLTPDEFRRIVRFDMLFMLDRLINQMSMSIHEELTSMIKAQKITDKGVEIELKK